MPNITRTSKGGRSVDTSDLLAGKKRDILLAVAKSKDAANNRKSLIKQPGFNTGFMEMTAKNGLDLYNSNTTITAFLNGAVLAVIKVNGYTLGNVTPAMTNAFKAAFASTYGVNPNLISIKITPGSMIIEVSVEPLSSIDLLDLDDKAFFSNIDSVVRGIQPSDVSNMIATAQIPQSSINPTGPLSIDTTATVVNTTADAVVAACEDSEYTSSIQTIFPNPFVGDSINNCMYTVVENKAVRITNSGRIELIGTHPVALEHGCRFIFINSASTHLIIPYYDGTPDNDFQERNEKIYIIKISNGELRTITLSDTDHAGTYGFDKVNNRLYYTTSSLHPTKSQELCYVTIADYTINSTLSATFGFSSISDMISKSKIEFSSPTIAYYAVGGAVYKLDLTSLTKTIIAGNDRQGNLSGFWNNDNNTEWGDLKYGGPYLDGVGTNAFFCWVGQPTLDSDNNRLLVCDAFAHRIRAISLNPPGNPTYEVTTIAGTSPIYYGAASCPPGNYNTALLSQLGQIGGWNNPINNMPQFVKQNNTYLTSTFKFPINATIFNGKIYVRTAETFPFDDLTTIPSSFQGVNPFTYCTTRQLSNGYVSDFTGVKTF